MPHTVLVDGVRTCMHAQIGRVADSQKNSMQGSDIVFGFTDGAEGGGRVAAATADGQKAPTWNAEAVTK